MKANFPCRKQGAVIGKSGLVFPLGLSKHENLSTPSVVIVESDVYGAP